MTSTSSVKAVEGTCHEINGKIAFNVEEDALVSHAGGDDDDYDQSFCVIEPDGFKLILHEILLCTKDPYISGDAGTVFSTVNTTSFKLNFKTNNAIQMAIYEESDAKGNSADRILQATSVNGNTIFVQVQTKTIRSAGAWR